jgi:hypothetical protein
MGRGPPGRRSTVDWPPLPTGGSHRSLAYGTPVHVGSPRLHGKDEELARVQSRASPETEERRGDRAIAVKTWRRWRSVRAMLKCGEKRGVERCGEARRWCTPFIGAGGCSGCNCR